MKPWLHKNEWVFLLLYSDHSFIVFLSSWFFHRWSFLSFIKGWVWLLVRHFHHRKTKNDKCIQTDRCNTSPGPLDVSEQAENRKYSPTLVTCYVFLHALCEVSSATSSLSRMVSSDFGSVEQCKSILSPLILCCTQCEASFDCLSSHFQLCSGLLKHLSHEGTL